MPLRYALNVGNASMERHADVDQIAIYAATGELSSLRDLETAVSTAGLQRWTVRCDAGGTSQTRSPA